MRYAVATVVFAGCLLLSCVLTWAKGRPNPITCPTDVAVALAEMCPCDGKMMPDDSVQPWRNHGKYVSCVVRYRNALRKAGCLTDESRRTIARCAARSTCGKVGAVLCCSYDAEAATTPRLAIWSPPVCAATTPRSSATWMPTAPRVKRASPATKRRARNTGAPPSAAEVSALRARHRHPEQPHRITGVGEVAGPRMEGPDGVCHPGLFFFALPGTAVCLPNGLLLSHRFPTFRAAPHPWLATLVCASGLLDGVTTRGANSKGASQRAVTEKAQRFAITCIHCHERMMTVPRVGDPEIVLLAAHLRVRHPQHYKADEEPRWADVQAHFRVTSEDAN